MARRRNPRKKDETLVDIVEARDQARSFVDDNQNMLLGLLTAAVIIIGGIFAYNNFYKKPRQEAAVKAMAQAQVQFERDSFALALQNPGADGEGFLAIIDNYGGTKAANLANYYAGICWLNLGEYDAAIAHLEDYNAAGEVLPVMKYGALGDAKGELGQLDEAASYYEKAIDAGDNEYLVAYYLKKVGQLYEKTGKPDKAKAAYTRIQKEYPTSTFARDIEKFIARVDVPAG